MVSSVYEQVAREADALPSDEQLRLIARLAERLAARPAGDFPAASCQRSWAEIQPAIKSTNLGICPVFSST